MEAALLSEADEQTTEEVEPIATIPNSKLFEWSGDVNIGAGAEECLQEAGNCKDPEHFHAWVCLANSFQSRDIGDKARAAKARKIRALYDAGQEGKPETASDSYVTLEAILSELATSDMDAVIDEVAQESVSRQLAVIFGELREDERFQDADQNSEELARQVKEPEDERDPEEFAQLQKAQEEYALELERRVNERKDREVEVLRDLPDEKVIDLLRKKRVNEQASESYMHTYYTWLMFVGTRRQAQHNTRYFEKIQDLKMAAPEVVKGLRDKIAELEDNINRGRGGSGN
jgi:hypothetical protein